MKKISEEVKTNLKTIYDDCLKEDISVRERQIRKWRRLKLLWEGFQRVWYSEVAHDWRIWDDQQDDQASSDQSYYDRPINVFKAYLESIIAALSVTVPAIRNYPEDATNSLDLSTARGSDKVAELIYRHNNVVLLWLHALFVFATEGMTACYSYEHADKSYGTYEEDEYEESVESYNTFTCPQCMAVSEVDSVPSVPNPEVPEGTEGQPQDICPACSQMVTPQYGQSERTQQNKVKTNIKPKTRICMKVCGGLYVKVPNYARCQAEVPYLIYSNEHDSSMLIEKYWEILKDDKDLLDCIKNQEGGSAYDQYGMWGRLSPQYQAEVPRNVVTENLCWIRPAKFNMLEGQEDIDELKRLFPEGVKICVINDKIIDVGAEAIDKHWTLSENALSDYLHFEPLGESLTSIQDITNDLISLILQTIEHGIGQTFVSPDIISTKAYSQTEATPGGIFPTKPLGNKKIGDGIYEFRTATLSGEVLPFSNNVQSMAQLASGALPSIFGGQLEGSDTASEYSMSRAQALQRLQNTWKTYTIWWKNIFTKNIPMFIDNMKTDEKDVKKTPEGGFINVIIMRDELEGKVGKVELEASENLPMTWGQRRDLLEKLMTNANPEIMQIIGAPENKTLLHEYLGLTDFYVPGEDDIIKQYDEIRILLQSEPIETPQGKFPSVDIDPTYDNSKIEFEIVRKWVISEEGRLTKTMNPPGYENVLLHGMQHFQVMQQQMMEAQLQQNPPPGDGANPAKETKPFNRQAPITGEDNVETVQ